MVHEGKVKISPAQVMMGELAYNRAFLAHPIGLHTNRKFGSHLEPVSATLLYAIRTII